MRQARGEAARWWWFRRNAELALGGRSNISKLVARGFEFLDIGEFSNVNVGGLSNGSLNVKDPLLPGDSNEAWLM